MARRFIVRLAWLCLVVAGCGDPVGVQTTPPRGPENPRSARLYVRITFEDALASGRGAGLARVQAELHAGLDARGQRRAVLDSTLTILGMTIRPFRTSFDGSLVYQAELALSAADFRRPLGLRAPRLAGVLPTDTPAITTGTGRIGPDTVRIAAGAALRLQLDTPASPWVPGRDVWSWSLILGAFSAPALVISGAGEAPAELIVPPNLLTPLTVAPFPAEYMSSKTRFERDQPDDTYFIYPSISVRLKWIVVPQ